MKTLFLLVVALGLASATQSCCPGCICGVNINDRLRGIAKLNGAKIAAVAPGLTFQDVLSAKKQVVAGLMYDFILKFHNKDGQNVYYTAKVYDHFGKVSLEGYKLVSENWVNSQLGNVKDTTAVMGCCYSVGYGTMMKKNYNTFEDKKQGDCTVGERIGGATKFEKDNCDNVKLRLGVTGGGKAPSKGCCYDVGYGAYMRKSYDNFKMAVKEDCNAEKRLGGATVYDARDCDTVKLELANTQKKPVLGGSGAQNNVLTGGWHDVDPTSAIAQTAGQFGADHIKGRINTILSNCKVQSCMSQVVAGVNYKIVLQCDEMGIQKKSFAVAIFKGLDGTMKVTEFHELGNLKKVMTNVPFKPCPGKSGTVTIKSCDATSWPPKKGSKETITASGTGTKTVTGGKWALKATWKGFTVLTDGGNVCDSVKGGCPAPAGAFAASVSIQMPAVEPSGHYVVTISATDQDGATLFCDESQFDD